MAMLACQMEHYLKLMIFAVLHYFYGSTDVYRSVALAIMDTISASTGDCETRPERACVEHTLTRAFSHECSVQCVD